MAPHQVQPDSPPQEGAGGGPASSSSSSKPITAEQKYMASLPSKNVAPLWTVMGAMVPPRPNPKASVAKWGYTEDMRPLLLEAGRVVDAESAERRVLMLVNPSMRAPYTTDTIYAGLQLILPGETAPAHRHTAFALRFIIEGERGFTAVGGKKVVMKKGDVILTPSWDWHDHGHEGNGPMIWLDGLDLPLYQSFPTNFAEMYGDSRYPSELVTPNLATNLIVPWSTAQSHLDSDSDSNNYSIYHYTIPSSSSSSSQQQQPLSKTIGAQAERISPGSSSPPIRETCSLVYHCFRGSGVTTLRRLLADGEQEQEQEQQQVTWKKGDTFAVPAWTERVHTASAAATYYEQEEESWEGEEENSRGANSSNSSGSSYLFAINDLPLLKGLGMYRREGEDGE